MGTLRVLYLACVVIISSSVIIILCNFSTHIVIAISPAFPRQEVTDADDDWIYYNATSLGKNTKVVHEQQIINITGNSTGNIRSVTYLSDSKTLNFTYWLTSPFKNEPPPGHVVSYLAYIDADSNKATGWNGIDYVSEIAFDNKTKNWKSTLGELSNSGYRLIEINKNFTGFDKSGNGSYLFLSLKLGSMNYPNQYRIIFLEKDWGTNKWTHEPFRVIDVVNTIYIPPLKFSISTIPNLVQLAPGHRDIIELSLKSRSNSSFGPVPPKINFYAKNEPDGVVLSFNPTQTFLSSDGSVTTEMGVDTLPSLTPRSYTARILGNVTFPPEVFGNPAVNVSVNSNMPIVLMGWTDQLREFTSIWFNPLSGIITATISIVTAIIGIGIGRRSKLQDR
jgi:hypothetical protein